MWQHLHKWKHGRGKNWGYGVRQRNKRGEAGHGRGNAGVHGAKAFGPGLQPTSGRVCIGHERAGDVN